MKNIILATAEDFENWLELAREVEPLFGPMVSEEGFRSGLMQAIKNGSAYCVRDIVDDKLLLLGGVIIVYELNEIAWLAVTHKSRRKGLGDKLLSCAIDKLDSSREITVTTFAPGIDTGIPAIKLYEKYGFKNIGRGPINPAGIETVLMSRGINNQ